METALFSVGSIVPLIASILDRLLEFTKRICKKVIKGVCESVLNALKTEFKGDKTLERLNIKNLLGHVEIKKLIAISKVTDPSKNEMCIGLQKALVDLYQTMRDPFDRTKDDILAEINKQH